MLIVELGVSSELLGITFYGMCKAQSLGVDLDVPAFGFGHGGSVLLDDRKGVDGVHRQAVVLAALGAFG